MRKGFTLIELLVVIAIISILASILFPVFARAREKGRQAACLSNDKQIALGVLQYAQDYDEHLPKFWYQTSTLASDTVYWSHEILPYIRNTQIFTCPSQVIAPSAADVASLGGMTNAMLCGTNYGLCGGVRGWNTAGGIAGWGTVSNGLSNYIGSSSLDRLVDASAMAMIGDIIRPCPDSGRDYPEFCYYDADSGASPLADKMMADRHNGGANIAFFDGHAKWSNRAALQRSWFVYPQQSSGE
ncbi:MAG: DUF1559 domain-containing protein [Phycisphaerales bacterium]